MTDDEVVAESAARTREMMLDTCRRARAAKARLMADPTLYRQPTPSAEPSRCTPRAGRLPGLACHPGPARVLGEEGLGRRAFS
jgi:hypothetical protein